MPQKAKELSALQVKALVTHRKVGAWNVGGPAAGLLLQIMRSQSKNKDSEVTASWVLRATIHGRVRQMGLGPYPAVSLREAREKALEARKAIRDGRDPIQERRVAKRKLAAKADRTITFKSAAIRYHRDVKSKELRSRRSRADWIRLLELHAYPIIGNLAVGDIDRSHIIKVLEQIDDEGNTLWPRPVGQALRAQVEAVLGWAAVRGYREGDNPARWRANLEIDLPKPSRVHKVRHHAALPWQDGPEFIADLRKVDSVAAKALEFVILTAARSGEVRQATWDQISLSERLWTVPCERMKAGKPHRVPLSKSAIRLLESLPHREGLLFPGGKHGDRKLHDYELGKLKLGRNTTVHGWRSSFKDFARSLGTRFTDEASELALAHVSSDATRAAYARDELLPERARLMQEWANYVESGEARIASVTKIKGER